MPSELFLYIVVLLCDWVLYYAEWVLPIQNSTIIWVSTVLYRVVLLCEWVLYHSERVLPIQSISLMRVSTVSCRMSTSFTELYPHASLYCIMPSELFLYRVVLLCEWVLYYAEWVLHIQNRTIMRVREDCIMPIASEYFLYRIVLLFEWVLYYTE